MIFFVPERDMALRRFTMEVMFSLYFSGLVMDSPAALSEAKCMTASGLCSEKTFSNKGASSKDPEMKVALESTRERSPLSKLSRTMTSCCSSRSALVAALPMYPAPPMTKIFIPFVRREGIKSFCDSPDYGLG